MLAEHRAAAFVEPRKRRIEIIRRHMVLLYRNGEGIVAIGQAVGPVRKRGLPGEAGAPRRGVLSGAGALPARHPGGARRRDQGRDGPHVLVPRGDSPLALGAPRVPAPASRGCASRRGPSPRPPVMPLDRRLVGVGVAEEMRMQLGGLLRPFHAVREPGRCPSRSCGPSRRATATAGRRADDAHAVAGSGRWPVSPWRRGGRSARGGPCP